MEIIIIVLMILLVVQYILSKKKLEKYKNITDVEEHISDLNKNAENDIKQKYAEAESKIKEKNKYVEQDLTKRENNIKEKERNLFVLNNDIKIKTSEVQKLTKKEDELKESIKELDRDIYSADYGVYNFKYDFISSDKYKDQIKEVRNKQKEIIKDKMACVCSTSWTVGNSQREGKKMINRNIKMMLRAFNGECDSIISNATYKNIKTMENKMEKSFENINKLNQVLNCKITYEYYQLKMDELFLVHEYNEKKYEEKEEQRIRNAQMKEEEKAQKEFEKELMRAEKEALDYAKALEKAKEELAKSNQSQVDKLNEKIMKLQAKLEEAENNKRSISQAQITKSGYIYIISNIGAFGENVYKIGMTRRLQPFDRIRELNGPSVPFTFDVHAMIFSENAPEFEWKLHKLLSHTKMNRVNNRKEFFNVDLKEIERVVRENNNSDFEFSYEHEAKEFRLSEKIRQEEALNVN